MIKNITMNQEAFSKIWIIILAVIFVVGGILAWQYFKVSEHEDNKIGNFKKQEILELDKCINIPSFSYNQFHFEGELNYLQKINCYRDFFTKKYDSELCEEIGYVERNGDETDIEKYFCYTGAALDKLDKRICEKINVDSRKVTCNLVVDIAAGYLTDEKEFNKCSDLFYDVYGCYGFLFQEEQLNETFCNNISQTEDCYMGIAIAKKRREFM